MKHGLSKFFRISSIFRIQSFKGEEKEVITLGWSLAVHNWRKENLPEVPIVQLPVKRKAEFLGLLLLKLEHDLHLLVSELLQLGRQLAEEGGHGLRSFGHPFLQDVRSVVLVALK